MAAGAAAAGAAEAPAPAPAPAPAARKPPPSDIFRQVGCGVFDLYRDAVAARKPVTSEAHGPAALAQAAAASGAGAGPRSSPRQKSLRSFISDLQNAVIVGCDCSYLTELAKALAKAVREVEQSNLPWKHFQVARYAAKMVRDLELCMRASPSVEYAVCMVGAAELIVKSHSSDDSGPESRKLRPELPLSSSKLGRAVCAFVWSLYGVLRIEPSDFEDDNILGLLPTWVTGVLRGLPLTRFAMLPVWVEEIAVSVATYVVLLRASRHEFELYCDDLGDGEELGPLRLSGPNISRTSTKYGIADLVWVCGSTTLLVEVKLGFGIPEKFYFPLTSDKCIEMNPNEALELVHWSQICPYAKAWLGKDSTGAGTEMHGLALIGCVPKQEPWAKSWVTSQTWPNLKKDDCDAALDAAFKSYSVEATPEVTKLIATFSEAKGALLLRDRKKRASFRRQQDGSTTCCWSAIGKQTFDEVTIVDREARRIADELPHCLSLRELTLRYCNMSADGYKAIFAGVARSTQLTSLNVLLDDYDASEVSTIGLEQLRESALTSLSLQCSKLDVKGAKYITTHVVGAKLAVLDLLDTNVPDGDALTVAELLRGTGVKLSLSWNSDIQAEVDKICEFSLV